jgi:hypothetical protein
VSVAATWIAMGYLPISARHGSCMNCRNASASPEGLRCTLGHFYVNRMGGCRSFADKILIGDAAPAQAAPVQATGVHP